MANMTIPEAERNLSPAQVAALDNRRRWGLVFQVIAGQFAFFAVLLLVWTGQDRPESPGWIHPMFYYNVLTGLVAVAVVVRLGLPLSAEEAVSPLTKPE